LTKIFGWSAEEARKGFWPHIDYSVNTLGS